jgi:small subunit ribosomal protein S1
MKQCKANPWEEFGTTNSKGDVISGKIKSITDFGIFIGLDGNIDGLIHLTDLSWNKVGEEAVRDYQKGQEVDAMVLSIDPERERISLGIKQIEKDPFASYISDKPKGSIVSGTVVSVDAKAAVVDLGDGIEGLLRASEMAKDRVEDARSFLNEGDQIEAKITGMDRKGRSIYLSIKAKDTEEEQEALKDYASAGADSSGATTSFGELLKEKMDS